MVNLGRPSLGCHLCRKRKVKCDLTRPACQRCQKFGEPCPGYREISVFRNETVSTIEGGQARGMGSRSASPDSERSGSATRWRISSVTGPASSLYEGAGASNPQSDSQPNAILEDEIKQLERAFKIPKGYLREPMDTDAIPIVLNHVTGKSPPGPSPELAMLAFLPRMLQAASSTSALTLTCRAVAAAYFHNESHGNDTAEKSAISAQTYGRALAAINENLRDSARCNGDEVLLCIWLMGLREQLVGESNATKGAAPANWRIHVQGLVGLLRARGTRQFNTQQGRDLFWLVYHSITTRAIIVGEAGPRETLEWLGALESYVDKNTSYGYKVSEYGYWATVICAKMRRVIDRRWDGAALDAAVREILEDMEELESEAIVSLTSDNRRAWQLRSGNGSKAAMPASQAQNMLQISFCNQYFSIRLRVHQTLLLLLRHVLATGGCTIDSAQLEQHRQNSAKIFRAMASEILA